MKAKIVEIKKLSKIVGIFTAILFVLINPKF